MDHAVNPDLHNPAGDGINDDAVAADDDFGISAPVPPKPLLRGWIHAGTLPVAIALGVVLTVLAEGTNIFLLIAGTYTPMTVAALEPPTTQILLTLVWSGALLGILFRLFWLSAPRWLYVVLYIGLGWTAVWFAGDLITANLAAVILVMVGGVAYTGGAVVYGLKRPDPAPGVFGFHEVFHTCTVIAFACHWAAMLLFVLTS